MDFSNWVRGLGSRAMFIGPEVGVLDSVFGFYKF